MKYILFLFFVLISVNLYSQQTGKYPAGSVYDKFYSSWKKRDFSKIKKEDIDRDTLLKELTLVVNQIDSSGLISLFDSLSQLYIFAHRDDRTYSSWYLSAGPAFNNYGNLNQELKVASLPVLKEVALNFIYFLGYSGKKGRTLHDFYLGLSFPNKIQSDDIELKVNGLNFLNYDFGYSILDTRLINLHTLSGLYWQHTFINYTFINPNPASNSVDNYSDLFGNIYNHKTEIDMEIRKNEIGLNLGLELDYHIKYSNNNNGIIIGAKAGMTFPFYKTDWKIDKRSYEQLPDIQFRQWYINLVFKLYSRKITTV